MKKILFLAFLLVVLQSCSEEVVTPSKQTNTTAVDDLNGLIR